MDISKSYDFFKPEMLKGRIHIIGCGAIGSTVAEMLTRFGITKITLWDFDDVEAKNIANQMFTSDDIGKKKVDAVAEFLRKINPDMGDDLVLKPDGWNGQALSGYIFLCVDNIDLRRKIAESCKGNPYVRALFDFRMRLTDAQHYAADWSNQKAVQAFLDSMAFTHEEAGFRVQYRAVRVHHGAADRSRRGVKFHQLREGRRYQERHSHRCVRVYAGRFLIGGLYERQ